MVVKCVIKGYKYYALLIAENEDEKNKAVVISKEPIRCKLEAGNQIMEQVMDVEYLGIRLSYGNIEEDLRGQILKAGCLNDTIWNNTYE